MQIGNKKIKSDIIVAPMAGISNGAFRELCFEFGAGLVYSEMVSDKAIFYHNKKTLDMLDIDDNYHPVSLQLFGHDIDTMVYSAKVLDQDTNCDFIDINMGCPVNKVIKAKAGSYMMLDEDYTCKVVEQIILNVSKPVTVKMRLGYNKDNINYLSLAKKLESVGVKAIALHARTRSQMYEGHSDWNHIKILKDNLNIPVIGNGDVKTVNDYLEMKKITNCDGVMIGRAIVGNPFLIKEINNYNLGLGSNSISYQDKFKYCLLHAKKLIDLKGEKLGISEMRGLAPHYITGLYNACEYKNRLNNMSTYLELEDIFNDYNKELSNNEIR